MGPSAQLPEGTTHCRAVRSCHHTEGAFLLFNVSSARRRFKRMQEGVGEEGSASQSIDLELGGIPMSIRNTMVWKIVIHLYRGGQLFSIRPKK